MSKTESKILPVLDDIPLLIIISLLDYTDMKKVALLNRRMFYLVMGHLFIYSEKCKRVLRGLGVPKTDLFYSKFQMMEMIYHLNGYNSCDPNGITVQDHKWAKDGHHIDVHWYYMNRDPNSLRCYEEWKSKGPRGDPVYNRRDGPASYSFHLNGRWASVMYFDMGLLHNPVGPACMDWRRNGQIAERVWYQNGGMCRNDLELPSKEQWHRNGTKKLQEWRSHNVLHRTDGPARISFYKNGQLKEIGHYQSGKLHKVDGPASTMWLPDRTKTDIWAVNDRRIHHRTRSLEEQQWDSQVQQTVYNVSVMVKQLGSDFY